MDTLDSASTVKDGEFPFYQQEKLTTSDIPQGPGSGLNADTLAYFKASSAANPSPNSLVPVNKNKRLNANTVPFVKTTVTVSPGAVASLGNATISVTFSTTFTSTPSAWVGQVSGSTYHNLVFKVNTITTTGCSLVVENPTAGSITPNCSVDVLAFGAI